MKFFRYKFRIKNLIALGIIKILCFALLVNKFSLVQETFELESKCKCKKNEKITVTKNPIISNHLLHVSVQRSFSSYILEFSNTQLLEHQITCDVYNEFRRGPNQKIIGISLYGTKKFYYEKLKNISISTKNYYPGWTIRVYHDNSIDKSVICKIVCLKDEKANIYYDNVDFCNVKLLYLNLYNYYQNKTVDLAYTHAMMWRWFPILDTFVDIFSSRDSDSFILEREVDSVNVWLNSSNIGHIMRDNPKHGTVILGGMWGFRSELNRKLASEIFSLMTDQTLALKYNTKLRNKKQGDQHFLKDYVFQLIENNSTIHDSYLCKKYKRSSPWPSKRKGDCFVGNSMDCNETASDFFTCPIECRRFTDWTTC